MYSAHTLKYAHIHTYTQLSYTSILGELPAAVSEFEGIQRERAVAPVALKGNAGATTTATVGTTSWRIESRACVGVGVY